MKHKCVIMPIHSKWLDLILINRKCIEVRKQGIRPDTEWILFYECGTGLITVKCKIDTTMKVHMGTMMRQQDTMQMGARMSFDELDKYANGKMFLFCIFMLRAKRLETPLTLSDVGLTRAPQSYVYREIEMVRSENRDTLEPCPINTGDYNA